MSSRYNNSDRQSGSFGTTVDSFFDTIPYDPNEPNDQETTKKRAESPGPDGSRRDTQHKSSSSRYRSQSPSPSRSPSGRKRSTRRRSQKRTPSPCHSSRSGSSGSSLSGEHSHRSLRRRRHRPSHKKSGTPDNTRVLSEQQILEQNGIDLKSLSLEAEKELSNLPKIGGIYDEVTANLESIKERLKYLSKNRRMFSIDKAMEIADAAYLLRLLGKPEHEIELAGKMAHSGALLLLQADILAQKGYQLLAESKRKLKLAVL